MTSAEFNYDVFISYSHRDETWVRDWLLPRLYTSGLRVCIFFDCLPEFFINIPSGSGSRPAPLPHRFTVGPSPISRPGALPAPGANGSRRRERGGRRIPARRALTLFERTTE